MANELIYQSEFTGQQMDAKFTAVGELTAALEALTGVVAQKYVKPATGIPSTDMDEDVQAALAKALTAVQSLADYYTKAEVDALLAAINAQEYVDVSTLPTASASTMGKIYLVGPDGSGYYSYYISSYDGSAYSWVGPLGTTEISLANYATKAELSQLDQKLDTIDYETDKISELIGLSKEIITADPTTGRSQSKQRIDASTGKWETVSNNERYQVYSPIVPGIRYTVTARPQRGAIIAILAESEPGITGDDVLFATGFPELISIEAGDSYSFTAPADAAGLYFQWLNNSQYYTFPSSVAWAAYSAEALLDEDIVDNLQSNDPSKILSAKQGKIIGETIFEEEEVSRSETDLSSSLSPYSSGKGVSYLSKNLYDSTNYDASEYVDVSGYDAIRFSLPKTTSEITELGVAFYDDEYNVVWGLQAAYTSPANGYVESVLPVPAGAKYFRLPKNKNTDTWGDPYLYGISISSATVSKDKAIIEQHNTIKLGQQDIVELNKINLRGHAISDSDMGCTDYIPCHNASSLKYTKVVGLTNAGLAFYNEQKQKVNATGWYVDSVEGDNGMAEVTIDIPEGAYYYRASGWNYANSLLYGQFEAELCGKEICVDGKRASNGEPTYFSVVYNSAIDNLSKTTFDEPSQAYTPVCTTGVVLLPPSYTMDGKPSPVIINFHGFSHYVNYKQWGNPGSDFAGFMQQKYRWANAGYVVVDVNHKNSAQQGSYSGLGSKQDDECYRKVWEFVRDHYNVQDTCFIACGSAGGPNGINACYNWPDVRAAVWLDCWIDTAENPGLNSYGTYYYGYTGEYDAAKVGTRNPMTRIKSIGETDYLQMPQCSVKLYRLSGNAKFMEPFVDIINAGNAVGDFQVRYCTGITHSVLVSGGDGTDPQAAVVDAEIIRWFDSH